MSQNQQDLAKKSACLADTDTQVSFKSFREMLVGPLSYRHIQFVLSRFEAPLHPRWLRFLKSAQEDMEGCNL